MTSLTNRVQQRGHCDVWVWVIKVLQLLPSSLSRAMHLLTSRDNLTGNSCNQCRFFIVYWLFSLKGWKWYISRICYWNSFWSHRGKIFTSAQQAELNVLAWACALAKGKTTNIYADSWHAFWVTPWLWNAVETAVFLTSNGVKIKNSNHVQNLFICHTCTGHLGCY